MIGQTLSHYRIVSELGRGGMGVVYLADDLVLGRQVAIKTLNETGLGQKRDRSRFLREARAVSALSHQNIATLYDYGETPDSVPYIVMEFVKGQTLADLINDSQLTLERALEIILDVAAALGEAHRSGIIHRDIKPSNIAINERGVVKVLDFGLAKQFETAATGSGAEKTPASSHETIQGVVLGTPLYLSPEQAMGVPVDLRSDLFSLGSVLYECITGRPAFGGKTVVDICAQVVRDEPKRPSALNPKVSAELDRVTLKALKKRPEDRYQTSAELSADLTAARSHAEDQAPTIRLPRRETPPIRTGSLIHSLIDQVRRPRLSVGVALLALLAVIVGFWVVPRFTRSALHVPPPEAQKMFHAGVNFMRQGMYFKSIKPLQKAVEIDPKFALAHARLGESWSELDFTDRARQESLMVANLVPNEADLPQLEGLYLKAIRSTVTPDLKSATEAYATIAKSNPNDAQAQLDLGRAYEKNEQIDEAIASYKTASTLDPQHPAAFLRLGVLYGRKGDLTNATKAFDQADALYETLSEPEGHAEVLYERGALARVNSHLDDAQQNLEDSLKIATSSANQHQQIRAMLQLSTVLYLRGTTESAKEMASKAVKLAKDNGIANLAAQGLIDLGNTYLGRNEPAAAKEVFQEAFQIAHNSSDGGRRNEAFALLGLARLNIEQNGNIDEAVDNLQKCRVFFEKGGYSNALSQVLLYSGRIKLLRGDFNGALLDLQPLLPIAERNNDQRLQANAHTLMGNSRLGLEDYPGSLVDFELGYNFYKSLNLPTHVGFLILDRAEVLWRLGRAGEAEAQLAELPSWLARIDNDFQQALLARAALARAGIAYSRGDFARAKSEAEQSIKLAGTNNDHTVAEAKFVLCLSLIRSGAKQDALRTSQETVNLAKTINDQSLLPAAMLINAEVLLDSDPKAALSLALQLQPGFAQVGQPESESRAWAIASRASRALNDTTAADEQVGNAKALLADLEQKWGPEAFNGYLSRPDIHAWRRMVE